MATMFEDKGLLLVLASISSALSDGAKAGADAGVTEMLKVVPISDIDHMHLIETIKAEPDGAGGQIVSAGEDLPDQRALFVEFGTVKMPAQPYFVVSMESEAVQAAFVAAVRDKLT